MASAGSHADLEAAAAELVRRTTAASNVPEKVDDPVTLARVAVLLGAGDRVTRRAA